MGKPDKLMCDIQGAGWSWDYWRKGEEDSLIQTQRNADFSTGMSTEEDLEWELKKVEGSGG